MFKKTFAAIAVVGLFSGSAQAFTTTSSGNANELAATLAGSGISISNPVLSLASSTGAGTFSGGASSVGFDSGVVLTTGTIGCVPGPNNQSDCTGEGTTTSLKFDFTSSTGNVFFRYVFGSEEYNEFVGSEYNDGFQLLLNGMNIAQLPGGAGDVTINNVNCETNSAFFRCGGNSGLQYDGLTTVLTASAYGLVGTNTFEFRVFDIGDEILDSGVFIEGGSFSATDDGSVPEPGSLALTGMALAVLAFRRRKS